MNLEYIFKLVMIGDMGVGKSSLLRQFMEHRYTNREEHTIGVAFGTILLDIFPKIKMTSTPVATAANMDSIKVRLHIWDTAGQERFRAITKSYYRGSVGVILVYDITNHTSFDRLESWLHDAKELTNSVIMLVGNKADCEIHREVSTERAQQFATQHNLLFTEASAKNGQNVETFFMNLTQEILTHVSDSSHQHRTTSELVENRQSSSRKLKCIC